MLADNQQIKEKTKTFRQENITTGYQKTKYGVIPSDWEIKKVKDILERVKNPVDVQKDVDYKQIGIRSHGKGIFYKKPVKGEELGNKAVFWIEPNCFVVNIVFAWELAVAKTTNDQIGFIASHRFPMYKPMEGVLDLDFITYLFKSPRGKYLLNLASPGGAGRNKTLGQKEFGELEVPIPSSLKEQQKIASILSTWDKAIELKEKLIEQKKEQKKGLLQRLLTGEVRLPGYEGVWKTFKIKEICDVVSGGTPSTNDIENWGGDIPWCTPTDISSSGKYIVNTKQSITEIGLKNSSANLLPKNSILMCSRATIGPRSINNVKMATNQGFKSFICKKEKLDFEFFYYLLSIYVPYFKKLASGSTFLEVSKKDIENTKVFMPKDIDEQKAIGFIIGDFDTAIELLEEEVIALKQQKKGLIQQLLTGKFRVRV